MQTNNGGQVHLQGKAPIDKRFLFKTAKVVGANIFVGIRAWNPMTNEFLCFVQTGSEVWLKEEFLENFVL